MNGFQFACSCCGEIHKGVPAFGTEAPLYYYDVPNNEREERTFLTSDTCMIDGEHFFVKACLELPILGNEDIVTFNAWLSLSKLNFSKFQELLDVQERAQHTPMVGCFRHGYIPLKILKD